MLIKLTPKSLSNVVRTTTDRINAAIKEKTGITVDRRIVEQSLSPAIAEGKEHAVLASELKTEAKSAEGVLAQLSASENKPSFCSLSVRLEAVAKSISMFDEYKREISYFQNKLEDNLVQTLGEQGMKYDFEDGILTGCKSESFTSIATSLLSNARSRSFTSISIDGADDCFMTPDEGVENFVCTVVMEAKGFKFDITFDYNICSSYGMDSVDARDIEINGESLSSYIERLDGEESAESLEEMTVEFFENFFRNIYFQGINDLGNKIPHNVSADLMRLIVEELA